MVVISEVGLLKTVSLPGHVNCPLSLFKDRSVYIGITENSCIPLDKRSHF